MGTRMKRATATRELSSPRRLSPSVLAVTGITNRSLRTLMSGPFWIDTPRPRKPLWNRSFPHPCLPRPVDRGGHHPRRAGEMLVHSSECLAVRCRCGGARSIILGVATSSTKGFRSGSQWGCSVSSAAKRQLRLLDELEVMAELAFPPTAEADDLTRDGADLVLVPAYRLYPSHFRTARSDSDSCATESEPDLASVCGQKVDEVPGGILIGPIDFSVPRSTT